jgi:hypothetical protein
VTDDAHGEKRELPGYPFGVFVLEQRQLALVAHEYDRLAERFDLFAERAAWKSVIQTFIGFCSAENPSDAALQTLTHFLYLTLFFNEARSREIPLELAVEYRAVLGGARSTSEHAVLQCARAFRPRLEQLLHDSSADASAFFHYVDLNLSAFVRDAHRKREITDDPDTVLARRLHTISALGYFEFWKLLLAVSPRSELFFASDIFHCQLLSAKIQGLVNDLCSLEKDERDGSPNLILLVARQRQLHVDAAIATVRGWHDQALDQYVAATNALLALEPEPRVRRYVEFIRSCTRGNLESMRALTSRYKC